MGRRGEGPGPNLQVRRGGSKRTGVEGEATGCLLTREREAPSCSEAWQPIYSSPWYGGKGNKREYTDPQHNNKSHCSDEPGPGNGRIRTEDSTNGRKGMVDCDERHGGRGFRVSAGCRYLRGYEFAAHLKLTAS